MLAYDTEYAMVDRDDDLRIGIKTSAITLGRADVAVVMASYGVYLAIWVLALGAARPGLAVLLPASPRPRRRRCGTGALIRDRTREGCFRAFRLNHWVGFAVFAGIVASYALR